MEFAVIWPMGSTIRSIGRLCIAWLTMLLLLTAAHAQTAEQLRQLEQLSPGQRAELLDALGQQQVAQKPLPEPTVVNPRRVAQSSLKSTEIREGQGIESLTNTITGERSRPELRRFGYDLFAGAPTTFAPATDIPVPVDYVIGPGDTIELQLFGSQNALYSLVVTREGVLNFPELGPVTVAGLLGDDCSRRRTHRQPNNSGSSNSSHPDSAPNCLTR